MVASTKSLVERQRAHQRTTVSAAVEPDIEQQSEKIGANMQVGIGAFGAWAIGVSANIGSFAFLIHGAMLAQAGPLASVVAWAIATLMSLPLAFTLAELSSMFPSAGGPYVYKYFALKRLLPGMGEMLGFLTGWIFWIYLVVGYACMSDGLANMLSKQFYGDANASPIWFGPLIIMSLFGGSTILNLMQVKSVARVNNVFTLLKLGTALFFAVIAFCSTKSSFANVLVGHAPGGNADLIANVMCVLPLAMAGFSGIEMAGCTSSETVNARKSVPKAILMTVATVSFVYIGICIAISSVAVFGLTPDKTMAVVPGTSFIGTVPSIGALLGGPLMGALFTFGVVMSIVSCGFTGVLAGARTSLSMAQTGLFPQQFARLNPLSRVPDYGLIVQCLFMTGTGVGAYLLCRAGLFPDAYTFLGASCSILYGSLAMLYGVCLLSLRYTDPQLPRPFRLGGNGNAVAWIVTIISLVVYGFVSFACTQASHQIAALLFLVAGVPVYFFYRKRSA
jgi:amino acid transporter